MLHQSLPLLCDSKIADSILLSVSHFSNNNNNNSIGSSRVLDVGLKFSKQSSGGGSSGRGFSSKAGAKTTTTPNVYGRRAQESVLEQEEAPQKLGFKTFPGQAFPFGVSQVENGINFAIFSQHATADCLKSYTLLITPSQGKV